MASMTAPYVSYDSPGLLLTPHAHHCRDACAVEFTLIARMKHMDVFRFELEGGSQIAKVAGPMRGGQVWHVQSSPCARWLACEV
jgi:hypothetical protein